MVVEIIELALFRLKMRAYGEGSVATIGACLPIYGCEHSCVKAYAYC